MAAELPQEGWYRDPVDPARRRWWDGKEWSTIVAPSVVNPGAATPARPTMADGTTLPYAAESTDRKGEPEQAEGEGRSRPSRVRLLQMAVALVAIVATAGVVLVNRDEAPQGPVDVPITTAVPAPTTEPAPTTTETPATEPAPESGEAPPYRDAYLACQAILAGSSLGDGGLDLQPLRDTDAQVVGTVTEIRFEATDADGATETYLCRTLFDGNGDVMVGRLYLDLQNVLGG